MQIQPHLQACNWGDKWGGLPCPFLKIEKRTLIRVSQLGSTSGGGQIGQNGQKLHENDKIDQNSGVKTVGGAWGGQANILGSAGDPPPSPSPVGETLLIFWGIKALIVSNLG